MNKRDILQSISFGESIAEFESDKLKDYFLETEFWRQVSNGSKDIIYGAKGAGKSAIYTTLINGKEEFYAHGILIALAENPTGNTAFANLKVDPPTSHTEFVRLWKLYFLVIALRILDEYKIENSHSRKLNKILSDCDLVPARFSFGSLLSTCLRFLKSFVNGKEVSTTAEIDPLTGMYIGQKFSISFGEPSKSDFDKGLIPIEYAYELLNDALNEIEVKLWITIDRLDVAFIESEDLETNALRALFKVYLDLIPYNNIGIKIFLRDDIWRRISSGGFKEASHIVKFQNLTWTKESLLNLIIRRILENPIIIDKYHLDKQAILSSIQKQEELFYQLFPRQIDIGSKKPSTLDWIISRTRDGKGVNTPRELIQLFSYAKAIEIRKLENGNDQIVEPNIISRYSLKEALYEVSKQRVVQTLYSEFPAAKDSIELLKGDKAEQNIQTLASRWQSNEEETLAKAKYLESIGFLELRGNPQSPQFKIPFLYRPYLGITQGMAIYEDDDNNEGEE